MQRSLDAVLVLYSWVNKKRSNVRKVMAKNIRQLALSVLVIAFTLFYITLKIVKSLLVSSDVEASDIVEYR